MAWPKISASSALFFLREIISGVRASSTRTLSALIDNGKAESPEKQSIAAGVLVMQPLELEPQPPLVTAEQDTVAEIIKGQLFVCAVDDVATVAAPPGRLIKIGGDRRDTQAESAIHRAHQFRHPGPPGNR